MSERRFRYTLFYHKEDAELYAYTDDKDLATKFFLQRRHDVFVKKQLKLSSTQLSELHQEYPGGLLRETVYHLGTQTVPIITTMMEYTTVMNCTISAIETKLPSLVISLPPTIFTKEFQDALKDIGYLDLWKYTQNESASTLDIKPNYLSVFLYLYGNTFTWEGYK